MPFFDVTLAIVLSVGVEVAACNRTGVDLGIARAGPMLGALMSTQVFTVAKAVVTFRAAKRFLVALKMAAEMR